ncbi:MAG: DUF3656 domain-containing protein [Bacillota bacterium]|nr:DUF3656 domain-containing protein [Bacillota bacterium]
MKKAELLAPAGSIESLIAAVQAGASAVYLGGNKFSARAFASNFDNENMIKAIKYCHLYGVKVYVTLNTLIKENEINEALDYVRFLFNAGADALIVQDFGISYLIKNMFPSFELHASTQMTVHNAEGAILMKKLGFQRIVLSRELSLSEIEYISKDLNIETEIFIHGALCVSYSGQCLMSSLIGGRSGNRGCCAQPCRMQYTLEDKINNKNKKGYLLSTKDICTINDIDKILESGVSSLKIEGRMKRPEYVAGTVQSYRKAIDDYYNNKVFDAEDIYINLLQLFNREGFSKAYLFGNTGSDMMAYTYPKNTGIHIGSISKDMNIILKEDVSVKDGIRVGSSDKGFVISKIIKNNQEVQYAHIGDRVKLNPILYKREDDLYKTSDSTLNGRLEEFYKDKFKNKKLLELHVDFIINKPLKLKTFYLGKCFTLEGEEIQTALKKPISKDKITENLKKSGDTPFKFDKIVFDSYVEGFITISAVNEARRNIIESIEKYIIDSFIMNSPVEEINKEECAANLKASYFPKLLVCINTKEQFDALKNFEAVTDIAVNVFMKDSDIKINDIFNYNVYLKVPNIIKTEFEYVSKVIEKNLTNIKGIITGNLGIINRFKDKTVIIGDYKLNMFNSYFEKFFYNYLQGSAISVELNNNEIKQMLSNMKNIHSQLLIYGRAELMISEYCLIGSIFGNKSAETQCTKPCRTSSYILKDRMNEKFLVSSDKFCRSYIYNSVPVNLIPKMNVIKKLDLSGLRMDFIDERYDEVVKVLDSFINNKAMEDDYKFTKGHFNRGVL